jgi:hypothetical protein
MVGGSPIGSPIGSRSLMPRSWQSPATNARLNAFAADTSVPEGPGVRVPVAAAARAAPEVRPVSYKRAAPADPPDGPAPPGRAPLSDA